MQSGPDPNQLRCTKCQAPLGQAVGRCPFCGTEISAAPDLSPPLQPAYVGLSEENRARMRPGMRPRKSSNKMGAAIFAAAALLLLVIAGTAAFFIIREPVETGAVASVAPPPSAAPERPPLNINGVVLTDGPKVDPTDVILLVRSRVSEGVSPTDVKLLGLTVHRARGGKVDLDDAEASVTYHYLVLHRDPRAPKAKELTAERVEFTLRADAPKVQRSEEDVKAKTVDEPTCVWSAAWRSAIASGLSEKDYFDVTYAIDEKGRDAIWTFEVPGRPDTRRLIDGKTCAIKLGTRKPAP